MTRIRIRFLALCCAVLMITAACSSGADTTTAELPTLADTSSESSSDDDGAGDEADAEAEDAEGEGEGDDDGVEVDPEIAMAEYEKCMEEQGVSISTAIEGGDGGVGFETLETDDDVADTELTSGEFDPEDFEAAAEACDPILEDAFGSFEMTPEQEAEMADQMLELEKCMSDQGFDIDMGGNSFQIDESIDFEAFEAAMSECGNGIFESVGAGE